jgi:hypothetical protein
LENKGKVAFSYLSACYFLWFGLWILMKTHMFVFCRSVPILSACRYHHIPI